MNNAKDIAKDRESGYIDSHSIKRVNSLKDIAPFPGEIVRYDGTTYKFIQVSKKKEKYKAKFSDENDYTIETRGHWVNIDHPSEKDKELLEKLNTITTITIKG